MGEQSVFKSDLLYVKVYNFILSSQMKKKTILVVDDSSTMRAIIKRELTDGGYEVITAENGMEALSMLAWMEELPDLMTLDIDMPVMNGFKVCKALQEWKDSDTISKQRAAAVPVIFISARDTIENRRKGFTLEVLDFISKPFNHGDLSRTVDKILKPQDRYAGMHVLVVDDSSSSRRMICRVLQRFGVRISEAEDGLTAYKLTEKSHFDMVITDYIMPKMCGDELGKLLRQQESTRQIPILIVSGKVSSDQTLVFFKSGASDYLGKPFIEEELTARVEMHLRERRYTKELEKLNKKLELLANIDGLTELYNRRYFQEEFTRLFGRAKRYDRELCCLLIDLDHFKNINDTYGHKAGDHVLQEFSILLKTRIRSTDVLARYGGEEFVLLTPDTNRAAAIELAEDIRKIAEQHTYSVGGYTLEVTTSIGVASYKELQPESPDQLLSSADGALYESKDNGRNLVTASA